VILYPQHTQIRTQSTSSNFVPDTVRLPIYRHYRHVLAIDRRSCVLYSKIASGRS